MNAVYIGAGIDINPPIYLKNINNFYYFDSQPNSEFGLHKYILDNGINAFERPNFIFELDLIMKTNDFNLNNIINNYRLYINKEQKIHYYTNIAIPELYIKINNIINNFDTLIIAGHDPDSIILNSTTKKLHFIGFQGTYYGKESIPENPNSIINRLHNKEIINKFKQYTYIYNDGTKKTFNDWESYCKHI